MSLPTAPALVTWYRANARDLPWRRETSPYRTLLSEFMLQQTRVETVLPYFAQFVAKWPTIEALAAAEEDEVLRAWAGLGYYSRARNLHRAARAIASAGFPRDPDALRALPGVGAYTAGAVASIAFDVPGVAVDGNVERAIARAFGVDDDVRSTPGRRALAGIVAGLHVGQRPSEVTQAVIELGATVCTPRSPRCGACPWRPSCASLAEPTARPNRPKKTPPTAIAAVAGLMWSGSRVLMGRRPPGLLGGLWEPISAPIEAGQDPRRVLRSAFQRLVGVDAQPKERLGEVVHVFTHRRLTLDCYAVTGDASEARVLDHYEDIALVDPEAPTVALSALTRRTMERCPPPPRSSSGTKSSRANSRTRTGRS